MPDVPEVSVEDQLQIANFLIVGLQQQVARYEFTFARYDQRTTDLEEIIKIQKQSIQFLESMLNRVEGVFQTQLDRQKVIIERLKKDLEDSRSSFKKKD